MQPQKILLADDDTDDQMLFADFIGHRSDITLLPFAENGEALLKQLNAIISTTSLPDLIILDQNMPKKNGLQTLRLLKENDRFAHIPVMIYSTYIDEQLLLESKRLNAIAVCTKPITRQGYDEMLNEVLKKMYA